MRRQAVCRGATALAWALTMTFVASCGEGGGGGNLPGNGGVSDPCTMDGQCRPTLICSTEGTCQPAGNVDEGEDCVLTGDCVEGLYCGPDRVCAAAGSNGEGGDCETTADCEQGLVCVIEGFGGRCRAAGDGDLEDLCGQTADCLAGLACETDRRGEMVCTDLEPGAGAGMPSMPYWPGEECEDESGIAVSYFRVPRGNEADGDFYRLPFPNDIRRTSAGLDLSGHPSPGTAVPVDIIDRYLRASEEDLEGFATNPVIYFRFSTRYSGGSLDGALRVVNLTPDSPDYGRVHGIMWMNTYGPITNYICPNWLAIRRFHGEPLRPNETYAAIIDTTIEVEADGGSFQRSEDLVALLGDEEPGDPVLAQAWEAYAPLRAWTVDETLEEPVDRDTILNAAVFTTQDPEAVTGRLREAVRALESPAVSDLTVCDEGVLSPCDDGTDARACSAADRAYVEIHGRIAVPVFQHGTPPYEEPEDGGGFELDADGLPTVARTEEVCFAMTVPSGALMPAEGYPLVIYAHGTGGSFRGAIQNGIAADLATAELEGSPLPVATLAIDLPQHGERRGGSERDPDRLFFNFTNPRAARDNVAQGAADLLSVVYFAEGFVLADADSPTGAEIRFDGTLLSLFAHSQGATHGSLMVPFEPGLAAVVLSGHGGDLTQSLLHKTEPVDIAGILPFALLDANADGELSVRNFHPALALFQAYFEPVDPTNFGRRIYREPAEGVGGRHLLQTYGLGDSYSPEQTMEAYARSARLPVVLPWITEEWSGFAEEEAPLVGNFRLDDLDWTMGLRQYAPDEGDDGHFVSTRTDAGRGDVLRFLVQAAGGTVPQIGQ